MGTSEIRLGVNISRAVAIQGFMNVPELLWLAEAASRHSRIVEIGSWTGRSTRALVDNTPGVVYAVDTWEGSPSGDLKDILLREGEDWALEQFQRNLGDAHNLRRFVMTSSMGCQALRPFGPFDMVFIDGDHEYKAVRNDIMHWLPLLSPGGLLCGHDYTLSRAHCAGVVRAVNEMVPDVQYMSLNDIERTIWWKP